jgi:hypothetical protein
MGIARCLDADQLIIDVFVVPALGHAANVIGNPSSQANTCSTTAGSLSLKVDSLMEKEN